MKWNGPSNSLVAADPCADNHQLAEATHRLSRKFEFPDDHIRVNDLEVIPASPHQSFVQPAGTRDLSNPVHFRVSPPVQDDLSQLQHWLAGFGHKSLNTFRSYRTEAMRFRLFLKCMYPERLGTEAERYLMRDATETDVMLYEAVLAQSSYAGAAAPRVSPATELLSSLQLESALVSGPFHRTKAREALPKNPFARASSQSSINLSLTILRAMYEAWREPPAQHMQPYVMFNPASRPSKQMPRAAVQSDRHIPKEVLTAMAQHNLRALEEAHADAHLFPDSASHRARVDKLERRQWIFTVLFGLWVRRQEAVSLKMNSFSQDFNGDWSVTVFRKGRKEQSIPISEWVLGGLKRYRQHLGFEATPKANDTRPAILRLEGRETTERNLTAETLYLEIKQLATEVSDEIALGRLMPDVTPAQREQAVTMLKSFSPHWFRHTGATLSINSGAMSLENASKFLGHSSVSITAAIYHHQDDAALRSGIDALSHLVN